VHDLADAGTAGGLGEAHGAHDVHGGIEGRIVDRVAHRDLGGKVEDDLRPDVREQPDQVGVDDVGLGELEVVAAFGRAQVLAATGAEVVEADDGMSIRQEAIYQR